MMLCLDMCVACADETQQEHREQLSKHVLCLLISSTGDRHTTAVLLTSALCRLCTSRHACFRKHMTTRQPHATAWHLCLKSDSA